MTENTTESTDHLAPAPEDTPEDTATGYAVYDRTTGQYVGPVSSDKPTAAEARKRVPEGHTAAVVRV